MEDQETVDLLRAFGVDHAQGFHLGPARPIGGGRGTAVAVPLASRSDEAALVGDGASTLDANSATALRSAPGLAREHGGAASALAAADIELPAGESFVGMTR